MKLLKLFRATLYNDYNCLHILRLKLNHVSNRGLQLILLLRISHGISKSQTLLADLWFWMNGPLLQTQTWKRHNWLDSWNNLMCKIPWLLVISLCKLSHQEYSSHISEAAHYCDLTMGAMASQVTSLTIVALVGRTSCERWNPPTKSQ